MELLNSPRALLWQPFPMSNRIYKLAATPRSSKLVYSDEIFLFPGYEHDFFEEALRGRRFCDMSSYFSAVEPR